MSLTYELLPAVRNIRLPETFTFDRRTLSTAANFRVTKYSDRLFYTDDQTELNILVSALASSGDIPRSVEKTESPDFSAILENAREVHVEITAAIDASEARADNVVSELNFAMGKWSYDDEHAKRAIAGCSVTFFMPHPPKSNDRSTALEEMKRYVLSNDLTSIIQDGIRPIGAQYPVLKSLGVKTLCLTSGVSFVQVSRGAMAVESPAASARVIHDAIARKREAAITWPRPLWLVVWVMGHYYSPDAMLESLRPGSDIAPFERIYVGGGTKVLLIKSTAPD